MFDKLSTMASSSKSVAAVENVSETVGMTVLDLPELALECILEKLSPAGLFNMACVCKPMRERCTSDHLWERHMREKWGRLLGPAATTAWLSYVASTPKCVRGGVSGRKQKGWIGWFLACMWPPSWFKSRLDGDSKRRSTSPANSIMAWYLALESGRFWFPAQVYNRESGHVGFVLSCYDADLSYDCHTDNFYARYLPHGRRAASVEEGVQWDRLRPSPVDTPAHELHISDCLKHLHPADHIEIQWRRNKEFPYGWWYGVVGHLESCDQNERYCNCHENDKVILEFNQYASGSRWRRTSISRKDHREVGNKIDGFYGGIRKVYSKEEISTWKRLWPTEALE